MESEQMEAMREALTARKLTRDKCGDLVIQGKRVNIHADFSGYVPYAGSETAKGLNAALAQCAVVTQEGVRTPLSTAPGESAWPLLPVREKRRSRSSSRKKLDSSQFPIKILIPDHEGLGVVSD